MGVNLSLVDANVKDLPDWDCTINGGAREIYNMLGRELPVKYISDHPYDCTVRPSDFSAWREVIGKDDFPNHEMYSRMLDRLEADPEIAIYVSF